MRWPVERFSFIPLSCSSWMTFLLYYFPSKFHIPSTSGQCLCAPCSANPSSWKSCGSSAATRVSFHEAVGREGLAGRYEQTVTTDGGGDAAVLPRLCCSLPPGWRPRPLYPKPCYLFSSLWIQKGSLEGCFKNTYVTGPLSIFCLGRPKRSEFSTRLGDWDAAVNFFI